MTLPDLPPSASQFIQSVLELRPSIAVFDCDGTLWSGDAGADFFYWEIERGLVSPEVCEWALARYREYAAGLVDEERMCGEMVTMNRGLPHQLLQHSARQFFDEIVSPRIFPDLQELTRRLAERGCELWAVSSTNSWLVEVGAAHFGIARDHVIAACVCIEDGCATDSLIRVPTDELKAFAVRELIAKPVDMAFGNSLHDLAMLEMARHPFCVNPNSDLQPIASERHWPIYWPAATR
ncbi:MAG TPA: haloacid dehalogenase-like hydrolase [Candidatus Binatia bacterium]|nr:haloacid dehalogenase-like hydrolase [Candidatus Binatia bacterium]